MFSRQSSGWGGNRPGSAGQHKGIFFSYSQSQKTTRTGRGRFLLEACGGTFLEAEHTYLTFLSVRRERTWGECSGAEERALGEGRHCTELPFVNSGGQVLTHQVLGS